jgi:hypothetical protein
MKKMRGNKGKKWENSGQERTQFASAKHWSQRCAGPDFGRSAFGSGLIQA